jgi:hypothetical protein
MTASLQLALLILVVVFVELLGVSGLGSAALPGADSPGARELPDPFLKPDGTRIQTKRAWPKQRKALLDLVLRYEYGQLPPATDKVMGKAENTEHKDDGTEQRILLSMGPGLAVHTHLILTMPAGKGPFPAIICGDLGWGRVSPEIVASILKRGYALAEFDRTEIAPDSKEVGGVYAAYPGYQGGRLAAWAWGYHRVIDYLCKMDTIDKKRIVVTGHSRGGKATLLAGATDERIALTAPNNSGCGGAGCYRVQAEKSEDLAAILKNFPFWFEPHFGEFIGRVDQLPFDQHTVKALIAPRSLLTTEALGDLWANPKGTEQTYLAAKEVFDFLGAGDRIGINFREGKHEHNTAAWSVLLDFADLQLLGKKTERKFDQLAFPEALRAFSWKAPK